GSHSHEATSPERYRNVTPVTVPNAEWYAAYTFARREKKAQASLREYGFESYLPCVPRVRQWHDRKKVVEFPLFAGYIFVRFPPQRLHVLLDVPGVVYIVRANGQLASIGNAEIENIARFVSGLERSGVEPAQVTFAEGHIVRVTEGPFQGVEGVVLQRRGRRRVLVGIRSIGIGFEVNIDNRLLQRVA
ncbi:MAG: UpxY family transcription antiterminator, partial [Longimicrobiales bacterium]